MVSTSGTDMDTLTADLLSRIERLEARLRTLEATQSPAPDASTPSASTGHLATEPSSRRDLFRYGAVALAAVAAGGVAASPVDAADGGAVVIGINNSSTNTTALFSSNGFGLYAVSTSANGYGLFGRAPVIGTYGDTVSTSAGGAGVQGGSYATTGQAPGVSGVATSPLAPAVYGRHSSGGNAVRAEIPSLADTNAIAMYALNYSSYAGGGPGDGGFAIYGLSAKGHGLVGATAAAGAAAVVGATNGVAGAYAAAFYGPVIVGGNFTVVGGAKSAAVPHPDGSHRRLYCVESPESWFEDFGEGALACGEATIALDPDFAAVVDTSKYHVFLTGQDGRCDLAVSEKTPSAFRVKAAASGDGTFAWRLVAKRKDIAAPRFESVEIPNEPTPPAVPDSVFQEAPTPLDLQQPLAGASQRQKRKA